MSLDVATDNVVVNDDYAHYNDEDWYDYVVVVVARPAGAVADNYASADERYHWTIQSHIYVCEAQTCCAPQDVLYKNKMKGF